MDLFPQARILSRTVLDLLFPIACVGCGVYNESDKNTDDGARWLCAACRERIEPEVSRCLVCREHSATGRTCYSCLPKTPLTGTIAVGWYHDPILRAAITALKFRGVRALADPLGVLLARRLIGRGPQAMGHGETALVPLPLYPRRERMRGFNQARLLAKAIGERLDLPVHDALVRTRSTAPQTSLLGSTAVRRQNVARAFALSPLPTPGPQLPPRLILVDDVLTSGATLEAAAAVLADAGAKEIWAAVVARG